MSRPRKDRAIEDTLTLLRAWRDAEAALAEMLPDTAEWLRARVAADDARRS